MQKAKILKYTKKKNKKRRERKEKRRFQRNNESDTENKNYENNESDPQSEYVDLITITIMMNGNKQKKTCHQIKRLREL